MKDAHVYDSVTTTKHKFILLKKKHVWRSGRFHKDACRLFTYLIIVTYLITVSF